MATLEQWKRAVVHIEAADDSIPARERADEMQERMQAWKDGEPPPDMSDLMGRDERRRGTAVFIADGKRRYLVTARHVLWDEEIAERSAHDFEGWPDADEKRQEAIDRWISPIIFRVPTLDDALGGHDREAPWMLMNLASGVTWIHPYEYSDPPYDLAVISLSQKGTRGYARELEDLGHVPISIDRVGVEPTGDGTEVFSIGYPAMTSVLKERELEPALAHWASGAISLPVFSFGRVVMTHAKLPYFWAELGCDGGSSGGPVVEGDELVGILIKRAERKEIREPFALVMRAEHLRPVLARQVAKDDERERLGLIA